MCSIIICANDSTHDPFWFAPQKTLKGGTVSPRAWSSRGSSIIDAHQYQGETCAPGYVVYYRVESVDDCMSNEEELCLPCGLRCGH